MCACKNYWYGILGTTVGNKDERTKRREDFFAHLNLRFSGGAKRTVPLLDESRQFAAAATRKIPNFKL